MGFLCSPFLSAFAFGFLVARTTWRWAYGIGSLYSLLVVFHIVFFCEETWVIIIFLRPTAKNRLIASFRMYDRTVRPVPEPTTTGLRYRVETLIGVTGWKMSKYRISWRESIISPLKVFSRPHLLIILIFEVCRSISIIGAREADAPF